jgi:hypothetical protein
MGCQGRQHGLLSLLRVAALRILRGMRVPSCPRANNDKADRLSKIGSTKQDIPAGVSLEIIRKPSIKPSPEFSSIYVPEDPAPAQMLLPPRG